MKSENFIPKFRAAVAGLSSEGLRTFYEAKGETVFSSELSQKDLGIDRFASHWESFVKRVQAECRQYEGLIKDLADLKKSKEQDHKKQKIVVQGVVKAVLILIVLAFTLLPTCKAVYRAVSEFATLTQESTQAALDDLCWLKDFGISYGIFLAQGVIFFIIQSIISRDGETPWIAGWALIGEIVINVGVCTYVNIISYNDFIVQEILEGIVFGAIVSIPMLAVLGLYAWRSYWIDELLD